MTQADRAHAFAALHQPGTPLVLYNCWDAGSGAAIAKGGAPALATGSWSVAGAQGYADGEALPLNTLLQIAARITATCSVPVSLDFEGGYATAPQELRTNIARVIDADIVGINFEDRVVAGDGLHDIDTQSARLTAIRAEADAHDVPLFINARTDLFLQSDPAEHSEHVEAAITRGKAYAEAGASGFFIPGLSDPEMIRAICDAVSLPVNAMCLDVTADVAPLAALGVSRISFGPAPYRAAMKALTLHAERLYT
ncbi:isocitrate lyase/phosphoenolpyruvate mutase family protein [uncultured Shimia sp.]|uniref:isocitrate lyase/PEP mutase family protein n=1 Tax=uncultured Shimia sp. TaxID=573152 RepID=UPI0025FEE771|nr:isocitrate lyase/phosphoenolpyruvate mutase family protein [uncultured Shimia sp.]